MATAGKDLTTEYMCYVDRINILVGRVCDWNGSTAVLAHHCQEMLAVVSLCLLAPAQHDTAQSL